MTLTEEYRRQRRQRLADAINDYFFNETASPTEFYDDLMDELNTIHSYHSKMISNVEKVYSLFKDDSVQQEMKERELEFADNVNYNVDVYKNTHPDFYKEYLKFIETNRF